MFNLKKLLPFVFLFIISCQTTRPTNTKKVILVSIDGFRPEFYNSKQFKTPTLKYLAKNGYAAKALTPVFPTLTYPNHTTLITGVLPNVHGIISNTRFSWNKGPTTEWFWDSKHIKVKTINTILEEKGYKTASIHWPVTLHSKISYLMPEIFPYDQWYKKSAWELVKDYDTNNIVDEINKAKKLIEFKNQHESDGWAIQAAKYIIETYQPKLTLIHLTNSDHIQHKFGRKSIELNKVVSTIDLRIKSLMSSIDSKTCLMIVGDHGFMDYSKSININKLFIDKGWIKVNKEKKIISWKVIAHAAGGQAAIYTKDISLISKVKNLLKKKQNIGFKIITKEKLNELGSYPDAIMAISAKNGFSISRKINSPLIDNKKQIYGVHGQLPTMPQMKSGFIGYNCQLEDKKLPSEVKNTQIAPLILDYLEIRPKL